MGAEEWSFFASRWTSQLYLLATALLPLLLLPREALPAPIDERTVEAAKLRPLRNELPYGVIKVRKDGEPGNSEATVSVVPGSSVASVTLERPMRV